MKKTILAVAALAVLCGFAAAQPANTTAPQFSTQLQWDPYAGGDAHGFRLYFGYSKDPAGSYFTNITVQGTGSTSYMFLGLPGVGYRSSVQAFSLDGRTSIMSKEVTWTNPPAMLAPVTGYRPAVIVYVP